jgi:hypothetical protein
MLNNILKIQGIIIGVLIILYLLGELLYMGMELEMMQYEYEYHESLHFQKGEADEEY